MNILKRTVKSSDAFDENVTSIETSVHPPKLHTFPINISVTEWSTGIKNIPPRIHTYSLLPHVPDFRNASNPFLPFPEEKNFTKTKNLARCWPQEYQSLLLTTKEEMEASVSSLKLFLCTISTWEEWMC